MEERMLLPEYALLLTPTGIKPLHELSNGDLVWSFTDDFTLIPLMKLRTKDSPKGHQIVKVIQACKTQWKDQTIVTDSLSRAVYVNDTMTVRTKERYVDVSESLNVPLKTVPVFDLKAKYTGPHLTKSHWYPRTYIGSIEPRSADTYTYWEIPHSLILDSCLIIH